ncbi:hypothetical protein CONPUDRAFT_146597 [Coniophora puteana RWD-64-598 SS2]|uniref:ABM domain-containing protein n=1 Tax=Coniophora puteana (strain RWD-64-598) TaxID=741705 RepID=A0A5M3MCV0_CONPW|nr:uncharacterized protein CONPUDRAFT_146597 [Coniophora puteana RWD-64-598 SS2]EIW76903.1 hypothetical protein CONPUDRAFT_146597 [Coniophora puteana RWD-64-598 SS2]
MSVATTEISILKLRDGAKKTVEANTSTMMDVLLATGNAQDSIHYGSPLEDPTLLLVFVDWNKKSDHDACSESDDFVNKVVPVLQASLGAAPAITHTPFKSGGATANTKRPALDATGKLYTRVTILRIVDDSPDKVRNLENDLEEAMSRIKEPETFRWGQSEEEFKEVTREGDEGDEEIVWRKQFAVLEGKNTAEAFDGGIQLDNTQVLHSFVVKLTTYPSK